LSTSSQRACVKLWSLCQSLNTEDARREAQELQNLISLADGIALKIGVSLGSEFQGEASS
jgi:L-threo-3-deoxy-hexylosonate aldolase